MALVGGGAHLDFRDRRGHTPVHAAVRGGNVFALKTLLDLGASPDCYDSKDLTPLYHCCLVDDNVECLNVLIHAGCKNTCVDSQGWTVLHQVCRYGRLEQLKLLLQTCSDDQQLINKQNATGNTALHVCSLYNQ
uniref:Uncharacterized protein n=1 Tax=Ciona intestinalis TaxID=7719 RepID=F7BJQ5_CIOIN